MSHSFYALNLFQKFALQRTNHNRHWWQLLTLRMLYLCKNSCFLFYQSLLCDWHLALALETGPKAWSSIFFKWHDSKNRKNSHRKKIFKSNVLLTLTTSNGPLQGLIRHIDCFLLARSHTIYGKFLVSAAGRRWLLQ